MAPSWFSLERLGEFGRYPLGLVGESGFGASTTASAVAEALGGGKDKEGGNNTGRVLVTGATAGLGAETARALHKAGVPLVLHGRRTEAVRALAEELGGQPFVVADLSDLAQVRTLGPEVIAAAAPAGGLRGVVLNAGLMMPPLGRTADNLELQLGVNVASHFALANFLAETVAETSARTGLEGRVVVVTSTAHQFCTAADVRAALADPAYENHSYNRVNAYAVSKLGNLLHAEELQRRFDRAGANVRCCSVHPGAVPASDLFRYIPIVPTSFITVVVASLPIFKSVPQGAASLVFGVLAPDGSYPKGAFISDVNVSACRSAVADDAALCAELWAKMVEITGTDYGSA